MDFSIYRVERSKFKKDRSHCAVPQCSSTAEKFPDLSFFRFPGSCNKNNHKNARHLLQLHRRKEWIRVLKLKKVSNRSVVCSKHFKDTDFTSTAIKYRRLNAKAIPSLFLPVDFSNRKKNAQIEKKMSIKEKENGYSLFTNFPDDAEQECLQENWSSTKHSSARSPEYLQEVHELAVNVISKNPETDDISSDPDEFSNLYFAKKSTDRTYLKEFRDYVCTIMRPMLSSTSVHSSFHNRPANFLSEGQIKQEDNEAEYHDSISLNDNSNISQNMTEEKPFNYWELVKCLEQIHKPNTWWTVSCCEDVVICAKWDATYTCHRKVIIREDLTAKIIVEKTKAILDIKINSCGSLSSMLQAVDEL